MIFLILFLCSSVFAAEQQFASLGDFKLQSGEVIRDCKIGYRTLGASRKDDNTIVILSYYKGTSADAEEFIENNWIDGSKYSIVAIDALSNGVSSSPSNSTLQPRMIFPQFTVRDLVESEHQLLTEVLHIDHVKAVIGASMGGMQVFQWIVSYPEFMDQAISIVGSPRTAIYDRVVWRAQLDAIMNDPGWKNGDYTEQPNAALSAEIGLLSATTPDELNRAFPPEKLNDAINDAKKQIAKYDANNRIRQLQAMLTHDIGPLERAAANLKCKLLVIASASDHEVTPDASFDFAKLLHIEPVVLTGNCGHVAPWCEPDKVRAAISAFLR